ncbi:Pex3p KNAG_0C05380 [Huiozyma naganishii CBS 8797]|uniref:Peroxin-3 n=1 Tax=Huiozyma naganishii (strain ATCC MYA-139 / BCRC 22969 / CBS 8797 / KCTC 17520 / NBRC 10181 / NCYC 3082 / Yp74L-3) TaxID=1071383 RepID=J7S6A5_HUIN7|nr:hypothetical protein KNAG_0C05380 [Kazachstania naganishii CBS 8797]CCK69636.1 hypothetical protein KNAG_0C05380 [Kazachstania naganishii CBS 8797]
MASRDSRRGGRSWLWTGGVLFVGAVSVGTVVWRRWLERRVREREAAAVMRVKVRDRFEATQREVVAAVRALVPVLEDCVAWGPCGGAGDAEGPLPLDVEALFAQLKRARAVGGGGGGGGDVLKNELWEELKLAAVMKLVMVAYTVSALTLLTKVQLNLLSRRQYFELLAEVTRGEDSGSWSSTVASWVCNWRRGSEPASTMSADSAGDEHRYANERAFLSLSWWTINRGWSSLHSAVETAVAREFGDVPVRGTLALDEYAQRLSRVFQHCNGLLLERGAVPFQGPILGSLLLPDDTMQSFVLAQTLEETTLGKLEQDGDTLFEQLVAETRGIVNQATGQDGDAAIVFEQLVQESYQYILECIAQGIAKKNKRPETGGDTVNAGTTTSAQMAVFAVVGKEVCRGLLDTAVVPGPNPGPSPAASADQLLARLDSLPQLEQLGAAVFTGTDQHHQR